jgi:hypothetical protein
MIRVLNAQTGAVERRGPRVLAAWRRRPWNSASGEDVSPYAGGGTRHGGVVIWRRAAAMVWSRWDCLGIQSGQIPTDLPSCPSACFPQ